jgi:hypothetical protein
MKETVLAHFATFLLPELERRRLLLSSDGRFSRVCLNSDTADDHSLVWTLTCFAQPGDSWDRLSFWTMAAILVSEIGLQGQVHWRLRESAAPRHSDFVEARTLLTHATPGVAFRQFDAELSFLLTAFDTVAARGRPPNILSRLAISFLPGFRSRHQRALVRKR